jgi:hypothetical protein
MADFRERRCGGINCIDVAQDMDQWWIIVHMVIKVKLSPCLTN